MENKEQSMLDVADLICSQLKKSEDFSNVKCLELADNDKMIPFIEITITLNACSYLLKIVNRRTK